jgi:ADP-ribosylglycohydrolase
MDRGQVEQSYGPNAASRTAMTFEERVSDMHRARWELGDWTDDTDQMVVILQSITYLGGVVDAVDVAWRIQHWCRNGFPDLGDVAGMGIGATVHAVVSDPNFTRDPHEVSRRVWEKSNRYLAANGAVMRTSVLGIVDFQDLSKVTANAERICKITHWDPRCVASCLIVSLCIALMLEGNLGDIEEVIEVAQKSTMCHLLTDDPGFDSAEFEAACAPVGSFADLNLDEPSSIGYTYKCLAAGLHGARSKASFEETIVQLAVQGGDADTNAAVAGALLGCKIGFKNLPQHWIRGLKNRAWLDRNIDNLLGLLIE